MKYTKNNNTYSTRRFLTHHQIEESKRKVKDAGNTTQQIHKLSFIYTQNNNAYSTKRFTAQHLIDPHQDKATISTLKSATKT